MSVMSEIIWVTTLVLLKRLGVCGDSADSETLQTLLGIGNRASPGWVGCSPIFLWVFARHAVLPSRFSAVS